MQAISPFLWFDDQAEQAAEFYVSIFDNSRILNVSRYPEGSPYPAGTAMGVSFVLDGLEFQALNAGPQFHFSEAISFFVSAETQEKINHLWESLLEGGGTESQCGWLKDRFGLSWQIVPPALGELLGDADPEKSRRTMEAMMTMQKIVIADLQRAHDGE
ncbi:VOC family protein [Subtercola boreus]|uniref:PhnB-like domain-containing protein n=1 Tax=Subtercola boreus TaxID=120213 RepID=A0A3E0WAZ4_9MICO|nr:VOC family protein [Subtercola boreus]RFA21020.1 hypothetical protein B7R24_06320 [Subtercola boreus]RFA21404.1 hypothetical protein B7R23_06265 [Subtercola boreus]RFA27375.1 hypothetical protein B7R25_06390 [Subtercola boreus]